MKKYTLSVLILCVCITAIVFLNNAGHAARIKGKSVALSRERFPVYVVHKTDDIYSLWSEKQAQGRIVVHLGKFLHFMKSDDSSQGSRSPMQITQGTKIEDILAGDPSHFNNDTPNYKNFLWVALQTNRVRGIYNIIPSAYFIKRFGLKDESAARNDIVENEFGSPRIISTRLPSITEPVLLNIDASYFDSTDPGQFLDTLLKAGLKSDLVTVCFAEDNPDVKDADRQKLKNFIAILAQHADIVHYNPPSQLTTVPK